MTSGQDYYFSINDDGYNFSLSLNGVLLAEYSDNYSSGNLITFYSREYYGTHSTELDYINIIHRTKHTGLNNSNHNSAVFFEWHI